MDDRLVLLYPWLPPSPDLLSGCGHWCSRIQRFIFISNILLPTLLLYATKRIKISWTFTDVYHMKNIWNKKYGSH